VSWIVEFPVAVGVILAETDFVKDEEERCGKGNEEKEKKRGSFEVLSSENLKILSGTL
jgi:hypothetical protein